MKPEQAIKSLNAQKEKLSTRTNVNTAWSTATRSLIKDYFGQDSEEYKFMSKFRFSSVIYVDEAYEEKSIKESIVRVSQFLDSCIENIERKGIYKAPKSNFLSRVDNAVILGGLTFLLTAVTYGGVQWGQHIADVQNYDLKQQVKAQQRTIESLRLKLKPLVKK